MSTSELTGIAREYREIAAAIKELEEQQETLKFAMIREMDARQAEELRAGEYTIRYVLIQSNRLDSAKLKADHADLYATYCKATTSTRFSVA